MNGRTFDSAPLTASEQREGPCQASQHAPIVDAYNAAKASGLYLRVKNDKGGLIAKAYATHNQLEYFAELSAIYFVGGNYYPFDRARLIRYDPVGTQMLRRLWGTK